MTRTTNTVLCSRSDAELARLFSEPPSVVIFCDGGKAVGFGHVSRCLALAETLEQKGCAVIFSTGTDGLASLAFLGGARFPAIKPEALAEPQTPELPINTVAIIDDYKATLDDCRRLRQWARQVVVIDDFGGRKLDCDVLVNPGTEDTKLLYADKTPSGVQIVSGAKYALIRTNVLTERAAAIDRHTREGNVKRILVSAGGVDSRLATPAFITAVLEVAGPNVMIDVLVGGNAKSMDTIREIKSRHPKQLALHVDSREVASLMRDCDLSIGPGGVTLYEKMVLGVPTIALPVSENQIPMVRHMDSVGAIRVLDESALSNHDLLVSEIKQLADNPADRVDLAVRASTTVDGKGAARVAGLICPDENT